MVYLVFASGFHYMDQILKKVQGAHQQLFVCPTEAFHQHQQSYGWFVCIWVYVNDFHCTPNTLSLPFADKYKLVAHINDGQHLEKLHVDIICEM